MFFVLVSREKQDRSLARPRPRPDEFRRLESIEVGHLDVQEDRREIFLQELPQGFGPRISQYQFLVEYLEGSLQRYQVLRAVVYQENFDPVLRLLRGRR